MKFNFKDFIYILGIILEFCSNFLLFIYDFFYKIGYHSNQIMLEFLNFLKRQIKKLLFKLIKPTIYVIIILIIIYIIDYT